MLSNMNTMIWNNEDLTWLYGNELQILHVNVYGNGL